MIVDLNDRMTQWEKVEAQKDSNARKLGKRPEDTSNGGTRKAPT
jgi:hypothetical protein